jgi:uncharacterized protein YwqG
MTMDECVEAARDYLPADALEHWTGLLRRSCRLRPLRPGENAAAVGRLGGNPRMPQDMAWPEWPGHGPLTFIASLDCAALPTDDIDLALPATGTLLFFYFDGQLDDGYEVVTAFDEETQPGARVLYVPEGVPVVERTAPVTEGTGIRPHTEQVLAADLFVSAPAYDASGDYLEHEEVFSALAHDLGGDYPHHRVGGYALPMQHTVELEVAHDDHAEAREWLLLAQIDSDEDAAMVWGDGGRLFWLIRPQDLAELRFDRARFTSQQC